MRIKRWHTVLFLSALSFASVLAGISQADWLATAAMSLSAGVAAFTSMGAAALLGGRWRLIEGLFGGLDRVYLVHKWLGVWALGFACFHLAFKASMGGRPRAAWACRLFDMPACARNHRPLDLEVGIGTTFSLRAPLGEAPMQRALATIAGIERIRPPRVAFLLIDDEAGVRNATVLYLRMLGHEVTPAASPQKVIEIPEKAPLSPDIIISVTSLGRHRTAPSSSTRPKAPPQPDPGGHPMLMERGCTVLTPGLSRSQDVS